MATALALAGPAAASGTSWRFETGAGEDGAWCAASVIGSAKKGKPAPELSVVFGEASVTVGVELGRPVEGMVLAVYRNGRPIRSARLRAIHPSSPGHAVLGWNEPVDTLVAALREGDLVAIERGGKPVYAAFGLNGSSAAIGKVLACFEKSCRVTAQGVTVCS